MTLVAIDAGTTHCKAGLFDVSGRLLALATRPTPLQKAKDGSIYDPQALWENVVALLRQVLDTAESSSVTAIGISSMAETGLLLSRDSGEPLTPLFPWFDTRTIPQAQSLAASTDVPARFLRTGMRPTYKCAVARLLWLRDQGVALAKNLVWLSVADYLAFRLCGAFVTDYSLAGRTYAFALREKTWDRQWLEEWRIPSGLFPQAHPAGAVVGHTNAASTVETGIATGTPVTIAGHDHVCAAFAAGAVQRGVVFDSMGTAETLVGGFKERDLQRADFDSGFTFGRHVGRDLYYWMGGLSTSGGSVEWLRAVLSDPPLSYEALEELLKTVEVPTGILYFPYLAGSGSPHSDDRITATFAGLRQEHGRAHLVKAVLEGVSYEMEWIRRAAERLLHVDIDRIVAGGGGARNRHWLQIKADVSGIPVSPMASPETTLLGAALLAASAGGVIDTLPGVTAQNLRFTQDSLVPHPQRHMLYRQFFEEGYAMLQQPLRQVLPSLR